MDRVKMVSGGLLLAGMVVIPGISNFVLVNFGYENAGDVVYVLGYITGISLFYLFWLRPLNIRSPTGSDSPEEVEADG